MAAPLIYESVSVNLTSEMVSQIEEMYGRRVQVAPKPMVSGHPFARACRDIEEGRLRESLAQRTRGTGRAWIEVGAKPGRSKAYTCNDGSCGKVSSWSGPRYPVRSNSWFSWACWLVSVLFWQLYPPVVWWFRRKIPRLGGEARGTGCDCEPTSCCCVTAGNYIAVDSAYEMISDGTVARMLANETDVLLALVRLYPGDHGQLAWGEGTYQKHVVDGHIRSRVMVVGGAIYDDADLYGCVALGGTRFTSMLGSYRVNIDIMERYASGALLRVTRGPFEFLRWRDRTEKHLDMSFTALEPETRFGAQHVGPTHIYQGRYVRVPRELSESLTTRVQSMEFSQATYVSLARKAHQWVSENRTAMRGVEDASSVVRCAVVNAMETLNEAHRHVSGMLQSRLKEFGVLSMGWDEQAASVLTRRRKQPRLKNKLMITFVAVVGLAWCWKPWRAKMLDTVREFSAVHAVSSAEVLKRVSVEFDWTSLFYLLILLLMVIAGSMTAAYSSSSRMVAVFVSPLLEELIKRTHPLANIWLPIMEWSLRRNRQSLSAVSVVLLHWYWGSLDLLEAVVLHTLHNIVALVRGDFGLANFWGLYSRKKLGKTEHVVVEGSCVVDGDVTDVVRLLKASVNKKGQPILTGEVDGCRPIRDGAALFGIGLFDPSEKQNLVVPSGCDCNLLAGVARRLLPGNQFRDYIVPSRTVWDAVRKSLHSVRRHIPGSEERYEHFQRKYGKKERAMLDEGVIGGAPRAGYSAFPKREKYAKCQNDNYGPVFKPRVIISPTWETRGYEGKHLSGLGEALRLLTRYHLEGLEWGRREVPGHLPLPVPLCYSSSVTAEDCAFFLDECASKARRAGRGEAQVISLDASNFDGSVNSQLLLEIAALHLILSDQCLPQRDQLKTYLRQRITAKISCCQPGVKLRLDGGMRSGSQDTNSGDTIVSYAVALAVATDVGAKLEGVLATGDDVVLVVTGETSLEKWVSGYRRYGFTMEGESTTMENVCAIDFCGMRGYHVKPYLWRGEVLDWTFKPKLGRFSYKVGWCIHPHLSKYAARWARGVAMSQLANGFGPAVGLPLVEDYFVAILNKTQGLQPFYEKKERREQAFRESKVKIEATEQTFVDIALVYGVGPTALRDVIHRFNGTSLGEIVQGVRSVMQHIVAVD